MAISLPCGKVRRWNIFTDLHYSGTYFWLLHDCRRNRPWPNDKKKSGSAFGKFGKSKWLSFGGWINAIIPVLIVPYYSVIGGWVIKYLIEYIKGNSQKLAEDGYFSEFISNGTSTEVCFLIFAFLTVAIIYAGVRNGVERVSKFMMPILVFLSVLITVYSVTRPGALAGVKYFLVPNIENFSWMTVVAAMGQMFIPCLLPWEFW